ncbi:hypothetical protein [Salmonella enterica]|nr:hypothetical protein [Salmonella enterica]
MPPPFSTHRIGTEASANPVCGKNGAGDSQMLPLQLLRALAWSNGNMSIWQESHW